MLGKLEIPLRGKKHFTVFGGPYLDRHGSMRGVKMAAEIDLPCDVSIPTKDFQVPDRKMLHKGLEQTVDLILADEPVYVGCMGGRGRTGLFLAILVKVFGVRYPVKYVRKNYFSHAVETTAQYDFVRYFRPRRSVVKKIRRARLMSYLSWPWKTELTRIPDE